MKLKMLKEVEVNGWILKAFFGDIAEYWYEDPLEFNGKEYESIEDFEKDYPELVSTQSGYHERKTICLDINLETGKVVNWPEGCKCEFYDAKIVDSGLYILIDENGEVVVTHDDYVPHCLGEGGYGDYLEFEVNENGYIEDWNFDQDDFNEILGVEED